MQISSLADEAQPYEIISFTWKKKFLKADGGGPRPGWPPLDPPLWTCCSERQVFELVFQRHLRNCWAPEMRSLSVLVETDYLAPLSACLWHQLNRNVLSCVPFMTQKLHFLDFHPVSYRQFSLTFFKQLWINIHLFSHGRRSGHSLAPHMLSLLKLRNSPLDKNFDLIWIDEPSPRMNE